MVGEAHPAKLAAIDCELSDGHRPKHGSDLPSSFSKPRDSIGGETIGKLEDANLMMTLGDLAEG
jgi:hypothetical protein